MRGKGMKLTTDKAFSKFLMYYNRAIENKVIEKPISWALYQTWKYFNEHEQSRYER